MSSPVLATKLYIPPPRAKIVLRPNLIGRLNEGLSSGCKLTLISAPAGFGKTTLLSEWIAGCERLEPKVRAAWLSLDAGDNDPARFLTYLIAALQTIAPKVGGASIGEGMLGVLQAPQLPPIESILTTLLNEIATIRDNFILVLDDYHAMDAQSIDASTSVDDALTFLLEHLPPPMHLVIATREDPHLPLARLRARGQLTELRAADLRFTPVEAAGFLNQVMGLNLSAEDIAALETRTEGWIAGLQLAALALQGTLSMQGHQDATSFINAFTGSHHFVLDYLMEEVLQQQSETIQTFLLRTSILDRMCGPLCDAVIDDRRWTADDGSLSSTVHRPSSKILEFLERANLFIIPLDNERYWYRYHHLFADFLRKQAALSSAAKSNWMAEYHRRASVWYEENGLVLEGFQHAAAGNDVERAARLLESQKMPLHFRGTVNTVLAWLESLPPAALNARPALWWRYASLLLVNGQAAGVEEKLNAAEAALQGAEANSETKDLLGQIAGTRASLALTRYQADMMLAQSRRALEYLRPENLTGRVTCTWILGVAHFLLGDRAAARQAYSEAITLSQASGNTFSAILASIGLANVQEAENSLYQAAHTYQQALQLAGDQPLLVIGEVHLGLSRVLYEWNELDAAEQHIRQSLSLVRQFDRTIDRFVICEVLLARLRLAQGNIAGAAAILAQADQSARQQNYGDRLPEIAAAQVQVLLSQGNLPAAAQLAQSHPLPLTLARVHLTQGDTSAALALLEPLRLQAEAKGWVDERLKVMVLQAVALFVQGEMDTALQLLAEVLTLAEPGGFIRIFLDEGAPMANLLAEAAAQGLMPEYIARILANTAREALAQPSLLPDQLLIEPLSQRELEILRLIAQGLSNAEIGRRLFLAIPTIKGHNRNIFDKLQVQRRTEAVARARELGLLQG